MDKKDSFILYTEYRDQLSLLPDDERGRLLMALIDYNTDGSIPDNLTDAGRMCFAFIRQRMDRDSAKYINTCKARAAAGALGGRPKKTKEETENQEKAKKANGFLEKQNNPDHDPDHDNDHDTEKESKRKKSRFAPPTPEGVKIYCQEHGYRVDAERFVDFYASKDWMIGKSRMKDWKAAVRNWDRSRREEVAAKGTKRQESTAKRNHFHNLEEHGYDYDEMVWEMANGGVK